ncbi:het-domain-containing protein [Diplodia corticola]|uniref:Het-domain-containing protein n=1 Tax=Diplodia corticola TaxID=236234 RepID=A0A1J9RZH1_9PEZI|nr:het-domain-containing protein [Diplodia corticola]OJD33188.1 het-domain-containing protein [Diplodia corticola]
MEEDPATSTSYGSNFGQIAGTIASQLPRDPHTKWDPGAQFISQRETDPNNDSEETYDKILEWISLCDQEHILCCPEKPTPLPTRVIDVGQRDTTHDPRLHVSSPDDYHPYLALSYCWGAAQPVHLTSTNLEEMCDRIDMSDLPKTLQDAITVTRQLNHRYLWVDSLCIVQNSQKDKAYEIDHMADVYRGAYLTISAAKASSCDQGFLQSQPLTRHNKNRHPFARLPLLYGDVELGRIVVEMDTYSTDPDEPIYSRAWTMQERLLSRRQLIYGYDALIWKCRTSTWGWKTWTRFCFEKPLVESLGMPSTEMVAASRAEYSKQVAGELSLCKNPDYGKHGKQRTAGWPYFLEYWHNIVCLYSSLKLSEYTDKLPGVAGIAAEVSHLSDATNISAGRYLAGLWEADLPRQLLWTVTYRSKPETGPYRAPSWSWASTAGNSYARYPFVIDEYLSQPAAQILECSTTPLHAGAPFGQVKDGFLKIKARLVKGTSMSEDLLSRTANLLSGNFVVITNHREFCQMDLFDSAETARERALASWMAQLGDCCGLILEKVVPGEQLFRRVGIFHSETTSFPDVEPSVFTII